jgi:ABC-2 type transport system ATP-binding protein
MEEFMACPALEVEGLSKVYGAIRAVDNISFAVSHGETVGLLGPNGAGKTTTINMILGVLEPTGGSVSVLGGRIRGQNRDIMERVNFAAAHERMPGNLTVSQNLLVFASLYGVRNTPDRIRALLQEFSLEEFASTKLGLLSSGEQARAALAKAMLNRPDLLLLDEPTASLDPSSASIIRGKILAYVRESGCGVLWASHNMHEVETVCDRVLFFSRGSILLEGDPRKLPQEHGKKNLEELFITVAREPLSLELE